MELEQDAKVPSFKAIKSLRNSEFTSRSSRKKSFQYEDRREPSMTVEQSLGRDESATSRLSSDDESASRPRRVVKRVSMLNIINQEQEKGLVEPEPVVSDTSFTSFNMQEFLEGFKKQSKMPKKLLISKSPVEEYRERIAAGEISGITKEEALYYLEAFNSFDLDGSGTISEPELLEAIRNLNLELTSEHIQEMIKAVDIDGDSDISIEEFIKLMVRIRCKGNFLNTEEKIREAFLLSDVDMDGMIGPDDLHHLFTDMGQDNVTLEDCKSMIYAVCKQYEGKVSFQQFKKLATEV